MIDGVAEVVTGHRRRFCKRDATTLRLILPPVKWRMVEWPRP
jgi:hypothetical protein